MKKTFNAVAWMRKRRTEIDKEDQGLSWEEKIEKTRKLLEKDPLWRRLRKRLVEPKSFPVAATKSYKQKVTEKYPH
jgi:hypothetical protein